MVKKICIITLLIATSQLLLDHDMVFAKQQVSNGLTITNNVSVEVNGEKVTFNEPILNKNGYLFLPMRNLFEMIGTSVYWNQNTKTASAKKNDKLVDVTLNSTSANVNGMKVTVNEPPFLYKDKTYVPIRFLSEHLGSNVKWNQQDQKVEITIKDEQTSDPKTTQAIEKPYYLHINNKRIAMDDPIITRQNRTYIPAEYFLENVDNASGKWLSKEQFELQISGLIFVFANGTNTIQVNDQSILSAEQPFIQSEKMYVPVKFIVNTVGEGAYLSYLSKQREMHIYLYQSMFTSSFLEKSFGSTKMPQSTPTAALLGNRTLLVSDNPETLTTSVIPNSTATLSEQNVHSDKALNEHRIYGWHFNKLEKNIELAITVENTSTTTSLLVTKSEGLYKSSSNSWVDYDIGLPIADQFLNNRLQQAESEGITISPGETKIIEVFPLDNAYIIGFLNDLDIQPINNDVSSYTIRTVLAENKEELTTIHSAPVPIDPSAAHPRGVWPSSSIVSEFPTYIIGEDQVGYSISNRKTDHFLSEESSSEQVNGSVGNSGHFGVNYIVKIPVNNPFGQPQNVKLTISGRGGLYSGAIKLNDQVHLIPSLKAGSEYIELPSYTINESNEIITLELMHSGGSNLPLAIYIETE